MKGYPNLFFLPFFMIICISLLSGFSGTSEHAAVEKLLRERVDIMQGFYSNELGAEEAEKLLYKIEDQPLLASEIRDLRAFADTDIDMVKDIEIMTLEKVSDLYGRKSYQCEILWHMKSYSGDYIQSVDYNIVLKKGATGYKLSEFKTVAPN